MSVSLPVEISKLGILNIGGINLFLVSYHQSGIAQVTILSAAGQFLSADMDAEESRVLPDKGIYLSMGY